MWNNKSLVTNKIIKSVDTMARILGETKNNESIVNSSFRMLNILIRSIDSGNSIVYPCEALFND